MKKVLIITYYWPPCGGIGVLRCLKFAKYLREFGWEPIIFTADQADYPTYDQSNFKDIPRGIKIIKQKIREPYKIYRFLTGRKKNENVNNVFYTNKSNKSLTHNFSVWIRSNFFIPDARCLWIKPSIKRLERYLNENHIDAIISNGPPHTNTRIATLIKKKFNIPWLADFQDPWTQVDYYKLLRLTKKADLLHKKMEQEVFKHANAITIVSHSWKEDLESIGAKNVEVINWGYDPDDYIELNHEIQNKFIISHLGIMGYDRNPKMLFKVLKELCEEIPNFKNDIIVKLAGQVHEEIFISCSAFNITDIIESVGNIDRKDALQLAKDSSILLLPLNKQANAEGRIPGKLFEYLAVRRPIICFGEVQGDSFEIINKTNSGLTIDYKNEIDLKNFILNNYRIFKKDLRIPDLNSDISIYSIKNLTKKVAGILNKIA